MAQDNSLNGLVDAARDTSAKGRAQLLEALNAICLKSGQELSPSEKAIVFDIFRQLVEVVETRVRKTLARILADRDDVPHDLAIKLANDEIDVADPILQHSAVLEDADLISIIAAQAEAHQLAITKRDSLSIAVSDALVDTNNHEVICSLLRNDGAEIREGTMDVLVDHSVDDREYQELVARRRELTADMARRMYSWVGDALRKHIANSFPEIDIELDDTITEAVDRALEETKFAVADGDPTSILGDSGYKPHPRSMVSALRNGDIRLFEELFRDITDLSVNSATRVLYDAGPEAVAIACKAAHVDGGTFSDIICYMHGGSDIQRYRQSQAYIKLMDYFERIDTKGAERVLNAWRETPVDAW